MVNYRKLARYIPPVLAVALIFGGISSMTDGFLGIIGGLIWVFAGLFYFAPVRRIISIPMGDDESRPKLEVLSTTAVAILIVGAIAGGVIMPSSPSDTSNSAPIPTTEEPTTVPPSTTTTEIVTTSQSTPTPTATPTATPTPTSTTTVPISEQTEWTVEVVEVTDGDTMDVRMPNGDIETIRLHGVDTPETSVTQVSANEWEGIPDTFDGRDWLANWGQQASGYAESQLAGEEIYIETDSSADRRGYYGRLLVYAYDSETSEKSFNLKLIENGYARLYESDFSKYTEFSEAESEAMSANTGVWDYTEPVQTTTESSVSGGEVYVSEVHADAEDNDHENLNDEYFTLTNGKDSAVDMGGWTVSDEAGYTYTIPSGFSLGAGDSVTIHTGSGSDTSSDLYWGSGSAVWNNGGDTITVENANGDTVIEYEYTG